MSKEITRMEKVDERWEWRLSSPERSSRDISEPQTTIREELSPALRFGNALRPALLLSKLDRRFKGFPIPGSQKNVSWSILFLITFLAAYLYIFNEWLFAVTKPGYMDDLGIAKQIEILFTVSALLAGVCFLCLLPLVALSLLPPLKKRYTVLLIYLGGLLPAIIFAALILIIVDNFTYTVFKYGIVSTESWSRALYGLAFIVMIILCYIRTINTLARLSYRTRVWGIPRKRLLGILTGFLLLSVTVLLIPDRVRTSSLSIPSTADSGLHPHILLITADGVDASHTSLYGYYRDTTPNLQKLAESALVAENSFSNTEHTTGSVTSIYTGKYPAATQLFWLPNILKGADSYEHLPGILRSQGYRTVQIAVPLFLDPAKINMLDAFDEVKFSNAVYSKYLNPISKVMPRDKALFMDEILKRFVDRIRHIFFAHRMTNPYLLVTTMPAMRVDLERWENLRQEIQTTKQPLFVHIHLMVTHGKTFNPVEQIFSAGQSVAGQPDWSNDFYDDAILEFDRNVGELVEYLTDVGLLDHTILIIGSDHGQRVDKQLKRVPLLFRFPNGQYAGSIQANVQNLDISPTLLDYLNLDQPEWMRGRSLIAGELEQRPIFGLSEIDPAAMELDNSSTVDGKKPPIPFDRFYLASLIYCHKWYKLDMYSRTWETGNVDGSTAVCPPGSELTDEEAFHWILKHFEENGIDVSTLDNSSSLID